MNDDRELKRHKRIMDKIESATIMRGLPKFNLRREICDYLATYIKIEDMKPNSYYDVAEMIIMCGNVTDERVKKVFFDSMEENWLVTSDILNLYENVVKGKRINYLLEEAERYRTRVFEFEQKEYDDGHKKMMALINNAFEKGDLPKVGLSELNSRLLKAVNSNDYVNNIKTSDIKELTEYFLENKSNKKLSRVLFDIVDKYDLTNDDKVMMAEQIYAELHLDKSIEHIVEEIKSKADRLAFIYKSDHEETVQNIKDAKRISQLPPNLKPANLTNYLKGNTIIYTNEDKITTEDLKEVTKYLLMGKTWDSNEIREQLISLTKLHYPGREDAFTLLLNKLKALPRTKYLIEEINAAMKKEAEFISKQDSNVNLYLIPNPKAPKDGGKFYNCYINRVGNLNLDEILPINLNSIIPPKMDIDAIEWYVQEYFDPTFKNAGAIILKQDETIGSINIFKPNDNKIGVTKEEKEKIDQISDLDRQIQEKQELLAKLNEEIEAKRAESARLDEEIEEKKQVSVRLDEDMETIIIEYETKAINLQNEMMNSINSFKEEVVKKRVKK